MSSSLNYSKGVIQGSIVRVTKGDTGSSDYSSHRCICNSIQIRGVSFGGMYANKNSG